MVKVCVVGLGRWGKVIASKLAEPNAPLQLEALCDPHIEGEDFVSDLKIYKNVEELAGDASIEACIISTPTDTHAHIAKKLVASGKHVLVAKPLVLDLNDCKELIEMATVRNLTVMAGHTTLYQNGIRKLRDLIGQSPVESFECVRNGVGAIQMGTNCMFDLSIHDAANILFITGQSPHRASHRFEAYGKCETAKAMMQIRLANGIRGTFSSSWVHPFRERFTMLRTHDSVFKYDELASVIEIYSVSTEEDVPNFTSKHAARLKVTQNDILMEELATFANYVERREMPADNIRIACDAVRMLSGSFDEGQAAKRKVAAGTAAIVLDKAGENILLHLRSDHKVWGLPGGSVSFGQSFSETVIREVEEETGFQVVVLREFGTFSHPDRYTFSYPDGNRVQGCMVGYECQVVGGEIDRNNEESLDVAWFPISNLPENIMPQHMPIIRQYLASREDKLFARD